MKIAELRRQVEEQRAWVAKCGGDLAGYVKHYGSKDDPEHFGNGGEAIYKADADYLHGLESRLAFAEKCLAPTRAQPKPDNKLTASLLDTLNSTLDTCLVVMPELLTQLLKAYEATGDHDHGSGPIAPGKPCPGGDCSVTRARRLLAALEYVPRAEVERELSRPGTVVRVSTLMGLFRVERAQHGAVEVIALDDAGQSFPDPERYIVATSHLRHRDEEG